MTHKVPVVKQIAWISAIPQLLLLGSFCYLYYFFGSQRPVFFGSVSYLFLSASLKASIPRYHRKAIKLVKAHNYQEAILLFEESVTFFIKYSWIDKYRFLILLSSSKMTYKELGLCNIAFCYSQIGEGLKAKEYYQRVLNEYPENSLANTALNFVNSLDKKVEI